MKRTSTPIAFLIFSMFLYACSASTPTMQPTNTGASEAGIQSQATHEVYEPLNACDNFFLPLTPGTTWLYSDGTALSVASFNGNDAEGTINVIKLSPDKSLEKQYINCSNGKTEIVKVGTLDKDFNETGSKTIKEISNGTCESKIILPEAKNLVTGKSWQQCTTSCHVVNDQPIIIKLGSFMTRRVECEDGTIRWYAPQIGLIKTCQGTACSELIQFRAPN